jgi:predicted GNAT family acetyltransferase
MTKYRRYFHESLFGSLNPLSIKVQKFEDFLKEKYPQLQELLLYIAADKSLYICDITIKKKDRGKGIGTNVMQDIVNFADENNLIITCTPSPEEMTMTMTQLINFYYKFGFKKNKGRYQRSDLGGAFSLDLYRLPQSKKNPIINEELFGKKFKIKSYYDIYDALLSKNPKPDEEYPYRITWFKNSIPFGHISMTNDETEYFIKNNTFPNSVIKPLENWLGGGPLGIVL